MCKYPEQHISCASDLDIVRVQIMNMEWGAFSTGLPLTDCDKEMDSESINPGEQVNLVVPRAVALMIFRNLSLFVSCSFLILIFYILISNVLIGSSSDSNQTIWHVFNFL